MTENKLDAVCGKVQGHLGLSDEALSELQRLVDGNLHLESTIDQTLSLAIQNGHGTFSLDKTTVFATISGSFTITAPPDGSWNITIKDGGTLIKQITGGTPGVSFPFRYSTGLNLRLRVDAQWSKAANTTLQIHLVASF